MQTYPKKRIEIIVEQPILRRLMAAMDNAGVTGYTVVPAMAGSGSDGPWQREDALSPAGHMVLVICILDANKVEAVLDTVYDIVSRQIGVVSISDCEVIRSERF